MNKNIAATIVGGILTCATAAEPVVNGIQGSMHQPDFVKLAVAVGMALFSWFTEFRTKQP